VADFVLKGHICYSESKNELITRENAYVVCVGGKSKGVFTELPQQYAVLPLKDYSDCLIVPGMIDLHIHAPQYAFRGMCMDLELMDWLNRYTFPEEAKYMELEYAERAYAIFVNALKASATTRAVVFATRHRPATELLMKLMEESGLASYVGKVNMDREAAEVLVEESAAVSASETVQWIEAVKEKYTNTKPILTPRFIPCCSDTLMEHLRQIQMAYGLPVQSHLSESPGEIDFVHFLRPDNAFYGEAYNDYDLFGKNEDNQTDVKTVMAHCVWSTDEEIDLMRKNGVFVAHCPASNMNLSSGIAPIRKYLDLGMNIGLGTDVAGGHSDSIFRAITDAIQVSKMYWRYVDQTMKPITFPEAFYMATLGGGAFFGAVGSFAEGYAFDAVVLDDTALVHPQELSVSERLERAVYLGLDTHGIRAKYVNGEKIIFKHMIL
jgi:guanine deaminase